MAAESASDLEPALVAATLVAASLAVLFALWQGDVAKALDQEPNPGGNENDKKACRQVRGVLFLKSLPLLITTILTFGILVHQIAPILCEAAHCNLELCSLNEVKALAVVNALVVGLLGLGLIAQFWALCVQWRTLGGLTRLFSRKSSSVSCQTKSNSSLLDAPASLRAAA